MKREEDYRVKNIGDIEKAIADLKMQLEKFTVIRGNTIKKKELSQKEIDNCEDNIKLLVEVAKMALKDCNEDDAMLLLEDKQLKETRLDALKENI